MKNNILNQNTENFSKKKLDWTVIQAEMKTKFGNDIFESWIKKIQFVNEFNDYILISVSTRFIRDWITSRYLDQILQLIKSYKSSINRIEFNITETKENKIINNNYQTTNEKNLLNNSNISFIKDSYLQYNRIDPNKKFENFILGLSNKIAYEASHKMLQDITHYNPLYIYGGVGLGKTHLLNAIGLNLKVKGKVMFISAERFMYHFIRSIKANEMVKFKDFFRMANIFIIDDIQFVNGKEAMQEEFFHTFNALIERGSQIVISSDRPPSDLDRIQERIRSRMSGGLVIDIQPPDLNLRIKILKSKFEEIKMNFKENYDLNDEVFKFLASEITSSVREMVGALNRVLAFNKINTKSPNIYECKRILKDFINSNNKSINVELIQNLVASHFHLNIQELLSPRRSRSLARPRQIAMYLAKQHTTNSLPDIGRKFSNRDHTTVIHAVKKIEELIKKDTDIKQSVFELKKKLL